MPSEAVLSSTHILCFRANISQYIPVLLYMKVGCNWVFIIRTCYHDGLKCPSGSTLFREVDPAWTIVITSNAQNCLSDNGWTVKIIK